MRKDFCRRSVGKGRAREGLLEEQVVEGEREVLQVGGCLEGEGSPKSWSLRVSLRLVLSRPWGMWPVTWGSSVAQPQADPIQWLQTILLDWAKAAFRDLNLDGPWNSQRGLCYGREGLRSNGCYCRQGNPESLSPI